MTVGTGLGLLLPSAAAVEERLLPSFILAALELHRTLAVQTERSNKIEDRISYAFNVYKECDPSEMEWALPYVVKTKVSPDPYPYPPFWPLPSRLLFVLFGQVCPHRLISWHSWPILTSATAKGGPSFTQGVH